MDERLSTIVNMTGDVALMLLATVVLVRLVGLRAFTKMSGFDFALTVATGSVIAGAVLSPDTNVGRGVVALAAIFGVQYGVAFARRRFERVERLLDNRPLLLMEGDQILSDNLSHARVTEADLMAKLREANVLDFAEVRAVVLEATGDVSVLHGPPDGASVDARLLAGIRRTP